jgi:hypothetical protein
MPMLPNGPISEDCWRELRDDFRIPRTGAFLDTGTAGSGPKVVRSVLSAIANA